MAKKRGLNLPKERTFVGPASIWKRIAAFASDLLILNVFVFFPFKGIFGKIIPDFQTFDEAYNYFVSNPGATQSLSLIALVMACIAILYFSWFELRLKQTPGKMIFHIFVQGEGEQLGFWQLVLRSLFVIPLFPFVLLWLADPLFMIFSKTNQRLSEILSKTKTVEEYLMDG